MKKWKTSKLFVRIFASLMCIVAFSSLVLIVASSLFTAKYENLLYQQNEKTIEAINEQLTQNIQSVYELCEVILDNQIVMENFRPYSETTASQRYHYSAIVNLLRQGRLQMNGLIDSLFLYTDMQKVLYAQEERGMADFNVFFDKLFCFVAPDVLSIATVAFACGLFKQLKDAFMRRMVIIVVKSHHMHFLLFSILYHRFTILNT